MVLIGKSMTRFEFIKIIFIKYNKLQMNRMQLNPLKYVPILLTVSVRVKRITIFSD